MSVCFILQDETEVSKLKILSRADSGQYHEENPGQYNEKNPGQYEETDEGQYYEINPGQVNNHHILVQLDWGTVMDMSKSDSYCTI